MTVRYALAARIIHWLTAGLVLLQVTIAVLNILLYESRPVLAEELVQAHISIGLLIGVLTLLRILIRMWTLSPRAYPGPLFMRSAAIGVHVLIYIALLVLPITGYLKLAALGFEITPILGPSLPPLSLNVALAATADRIHNIAAFVLGGLLLAHIAAVILHLRLDGRAIIRRMTF